MRSYSMLRPAAVLCAAGAALAAGSPAAADLTGTLEQPAAAGGLVAADAWAASTAGEGVRFTWDVGRNTDGSWRYEYTIATPEGKGVPSPGHVIFALSPDVSSSSLFDFGGSIDDAEFGLFRATPGNPGFPLSYEIWGANFEIADGTPAVIAFSSDLAPVWSDFYAKGGRASYAYNSGLGTPVANAADALATPVGFGGDPVFKVLVPGRVPAPGALVVLGLAGLAAMRRRG